MKGTVITKVCNANIPTLEDFESACIEAIQKTNNPVLGVCTCVVAS